MRAVLVFSGLAIAVALTIPHLTRDLGKPDSDRKETLAATSVAEVSRSSASMGGVTIRRSDNGSFRAEGVVDGRRMNFIVDTGATLIALTAEDAARLGIHPSRSDYSAQVRTANGIVRAAAVSLNMVEIGHIMVQNVPALVLPKEALSENLLGLSFLSRLRRYEFSDKRLVLEQ